MLFSSGKSALELGARTPLVVPGITSNKPLLVTKGFATNGARTIPPEASTNLEACGADPGPTQPVCGLASGAKASVKLKEVFQGIKAA